MTPLAFLGPYVFAHAAICLSVTMIVDWFGACASAITLPEVA